MNQQDKNQTAYSQEEAYFFKINKELIERKRKELDSKKSANIDQSKNPYWMMCPKCGNSMKEIALMGINVDKCGSCQGIFFDNGELQILLESKEPKGFLGMMKRLL